MSDNNEEGKRSSSLKVVAKTVEPIQHHANEWYEHWMKEIDAARTALKCQTTDLGAVFYTDGGCRPGGRGIGGWGVHGFIYTDDVPKQGHGCKGFFPSPVGYAENSREDAAKVTVIKYIDGCGSLIPESTNNRAELEAALQAIRLVRRLGIKRVHLILDSEYVLKGIPKLEAWKMNNWTLGSGDPVANVGQWVQVHELMTELVAAEIAVTWEWTRGHSDSIGNIAADQNATRGVIVGRKGINAIDITYSDTRGYWNPDIEYNRFLSESRWYFRTNTGHAHITPDKRWTYHLGNHGPDDELFGKRVSDANFSVVQLAQPDLVLETIREHQNKVEPSLFNMVVVGRMDNIFNPRNYRDLMKNDSFYLQRMGVKVDLFTADEQPLTRELRPPRLAFRAIESLSELENVLNDIQDEERKKFYTLTDITDILYETDSSKKKPVRKLKPNIDTSLATIEVDVNYNLTGEVKSVPHKLSIGIDTPKRNMLAAIASDEPQVFVVTWKESVLAFRYATVVKTQRDIGIWAGVYSNLRIVTP